MIKKLVLVKEDNKWVDYVNMRTYIVLENALRELYNKNDSREFDIREGEVYQNFEDGHSGVTYQNAEFLSSLIETYGDESDD